MSATIARIIGGAGTGKTTELLRIMQETLERGVRDPLQVGFVSFTRAARREAAERAAAQFGVRTQELEEAGWFRTLHSICYKMLGVASKELITGNAESRRWLEDALQEPIEDSRDATEDQFAELVFSAGTKATAALRLWDAARNRLEPFEDAWRRVAEVDDGTPDLEYCRGIVERYEQAKRLDSRLDFVDMLGRFAGYKFWFEGPDHTDPDGDVPALPVWFFDEQQDTSALLDAVCRRLITAPQVKWVYVVGDPYQSIYQWAGADARHFMAWEVAKQRVLPKSYRCPPEIHDLGEEILRGCTDYWDRGIAAADHDGTVESRPYKSGVADEVDPRQSWLLLARSNWHAKRIAKTLDKRNIPWLPTKGGGSWNAPVRNAGLICLLALERGEPIDGEQWQHALKLVPSTHQGTRLLESGTKKRFTELGDDAGQEHPWVMLGRLEELGGTPALVGLIQSGQWRTLTDSAESFTDAIDTWGEDVVLNPQVKVGTIHSVKGAEADNVVVLTSTSRQVHNGRQTDEGEDAERRVWYVAATRARKRLIIAKERTRYAMEVEV